MVQKRIKLTEKTGGVNIRSEMDNSREKLISFLTNVRARVYNSCARIYARIFMKERCQAKFLEGHLNKLGLLIGPHKSGRFVWANQEA